ncbi:MAG: sensor domain-containing diguanylate cyclase [Gammaproteobacteria bacterium]|nr:sensor domain-containing diguanylate cyclase [Gammaproteobacteria bacterium]
MNSQQTLEELQTRIDILQQENQTLRQLLNQQNTFDSSVFSCYNQHITLPFAIRAAGLGLWSMDLQRCAVNWSAELCDILGLERSEFLLRNGNNFTLERFLEYIHPDDRNRVRNEINDCLTKHTMLNSIFRVLHSAGHSKWIHCIGDCGFASDGTPEHMSGFVWDISDHKSNEEQLRTLTITDALTGLYNRRHLTQVLEEELRYCARFRTEVCAVCIDIDHFKNINDNFGHEMGDRFLRALADLMRHTFRNVDSLFRWGGEEFVAILPNANIHDAKHAAERLCTAFHALQIDGARTTLSAGVASSRQLSTPLANYTELLEICDEALYAAKNAGRNRVVAAVRQTETAQI